MKENNLCKINIKKYYFLILFLNFFIFMIINSFNQKAIIIKYKEYISKCKKRIKFKEKNSLKFFF